MARTTNNSNKESIGYVAQSTNSSDPPTPLGSSGVCYRCVVSFPLLLASARTLPRGALSSLIPGREQWMSLGTQKLQNRSQYGIPSEPASDGSKWKSNFSWKSEIVIVKDMSKSFVWWIPHNKRINVRSFSTWRFGLRPHMRSDLSKTHDLRVSEKHINA